MILITKPFYCLKFDLFTVLVPNVPNEKKLCSINKGLLFILHTSLSVKNQSLTFMSWRYFIILQIIILAIVLTLVSALVYQHENKVSLVKTPPEELAKWYKPENKRQVWLHNMFKLRREMQAVDFYAKQENSKHLAKWTEQLSKHYNKISDMVPNWQKKLDRQTIQALSNASAAKNYALIPLHLEKLQQNCDSCHSDYQAITALTYRAADFSSIKVNENTSFNDHMNTLTKQVNQIKISADDGFTQQALSSLNQLNLSMNELGKSCINCHKTDKKTYPSNLMATTLTSLETALISGTAKEQGQELGSLAVIACARCHGTHRIAYGAKKQLTKEVNFRELLKH